MRHATYSEVIAILSWGTLHTLQLLQHCHEARYIHYSYSNTVLSYATYLAVIATQSWGTLSFLCQLACERVAARIHLTALVNSTTVTLLTFVNNIVPTVSLVRQLQKNPVVNPQSCVFTVTITQPLSAGRYPNYNVTVLQVIASKITFMIQVSISLPIWEEMTFTGNNQTSYLQQWDAF
jgi:hypothetical protein